MCRHGIPQVLLTDLGSNFTSGMFEETCRILKIQHLTATVARPQSIGQVERFHRSLGQYLRAFTESDRDTWDELIPFALLVYNSTKHSTTMFSPHFLVYGKEVDIPSNLKTNPNPIYNYDNYASILKNRLKLAHEIAKDNIIKSKNQNKRRYDKTHNNEIFYERGDKVYILDENRDHKFDALYKGPYEIIDVPSEENCLLKIKNRQKLIHKNKLKLATKGTQLEH